MPRNWHHERVARHTRVTYVISIWRESLGRSYERISPIFVSGTSKDHARNRALALVEARLIADTGVPFVEGTQWTIDREMRRAPYAVIEERHTMFYRSHAKRGRRRFDTIKGRHEIVQAEGRIVPSVGERGWTP